MKTLLFSLSIMLLLNACQPAKNSINTATIKKEINTIMNDWHKNASIADFEKYFNAMDKESIFIGTDAIENWTKEDFMNFSKPHFDKGRAWNFKTLERNIYTSKEGNVVWFDELLDTWMGPCRGSGVLQKDGKEWKIKHYVLSFTIPNNKTKEVIEIKKEEDTSILNKFK